MKQKRSNPGATADRNVMSWFRLAGTHLSGIESLTLRHYTRKTLAAVVPFTDVYSGGLFSFLTPWKLSPTINPQGMGSRTPDESHLCLSSAEQEAEDREVARKEIRSQEARERVVSEARVG